MIDVLIARGRSLLVITDPEPQTDPRRRGLSPDVAAAVTAAEHVWQFPQR
jgi:hypothetical protein